VLRVSATLVGVGLTRGPGWPAHPRGRTARPSRSVATGTDGCHRPTSRHHHVGDRARARFPLARTNGARPRILTVPCSARCPCGPSLPPSHEGTDSSFRGRPPWAIGLLWRLLNGISESRRGAGVAVRSSRASSRIRRAFLLFIFQPRVRVTSCPPPDAPDALGVTWILIGLIPAGMIYVPGLPATLYQSREGPIVGLQQVALNVGHALGFDLPEPWQWIACALLVGSFLTGLVFTAKLERWRIGLLIGSASVAFAVAGGVHFPRSSCTWARSYALRGPLGAMAQPLDAGDRRRLVLWAFPQPWTRAPSIDLRSGCAALAKPANRRAVKRRSSGSVSRICSGCPGRIHDVSTSSRNDAWDTDISAT